MKQAYYDYIIVGAGLCGLSLAKELSQMNKRVLLLEKGRYVKRLGSVLDLMDVYDKAAFSYSKQGFGILRAFGVGGTSLVCCGNAIEPSKEEVSRLGINILGELDEAKNECNVSTTSFPLGRVSMKMKDVFNALGYEMQIMPKFGAVGSCVSCGDCVLGCRYGAKWTALEFFKKSKRENIDVVSRFTVDKVLSKNGKATGVVGRGFMVPRSSFFSERIILSAGGVGTPVILQHSGMEAGNNFFADLFNITYGYHDFLNQHRELAMSMVCTKFREKEGLVLSPVVDNVMGLLSTIEVKDFFKALKFSRLLGIMTKIADDGEGKVHENGSIDKEPTKRDLDRLRKGSGIAQQILIQCGVKPETIFVTKPRGAHPGGTAAVGSVVDKNFETKIKGLYVCDASVLPFAPGIPPMLMLIALTKWFIKKC